MGQKREKREEKQIELCSTEDPDISSSTDVPMPSGQEGDSVKEPDPVGKKAVSRCSECRRRVGLTGFRCRCGELFCSEHRYSDRHDCRFDYKAAGRAAIARENPVVRPAKILKV